MLIGRRQVNLIVAAAVALWCAGIWYFLYFQKGFDDLLGNIISDIFFAIFVVFFVEYSIGRDAHERNKGRRRALAFILRQFQGHVLTLIEAYIRDGVLSSGEEALPSKAAVAALAERKHSKTEIGEFKDNPLQYAAYYICKFTGETPAHVMPPRKARTWIVELTKSVDQSYDDVLELDNGLLPDEVIDALSRLKDGPLVITGRLLMNLRGTQLYWAEQQLREISDRLDTIRKYISLGLDVEIPLSREKIREAIVNALSVAGSGKV